MSNYSLKDQVALVTGASSGIGKAIAIALGSAGAKVIINYHSDDKGAADTLKAIEAANGEGHIIKADIGKEADVLMMFEETIKKYGNLDILVNNAGIQADAKITEMTLAQWEKVIDTNLTGQFLCSRSAIQQFIKQGITERSSAVGKIIFISSVHNIIPWAGHANYATSKGGETMLMKTLAQEVAPQKIRINSIAPGAIKTHINQSVWGDPEKAKDLMKLIPYQRIGEPEDVAKLAVFLASDDADYMTGANIFIDGGMTLYPGFADNG